MSWKKALTIGTLLTGATAVGIHLLNKAIYLSAVAEHLLKPSAETYYDWKFGKVYYTKRGEGAPLLLIHDLNTYSSGYEWHALTEKLAKKRTVYTLDLIGCGRSEKPNLTYTNYLYVQLINDFIKNVVKDSCDVVATGDSCPLVLGACQSGESSIKSISMINPEDIHKVAHIPTYRSRILTKLILLPLAGTLLYNILMRKENIETALKGAFFDKNKIRQSLVQTYYETAHCGNASSKYLFSSICGNYLTANVMLYLKDLSNSIYIITGCDEKKQNDAEKYKKVLPSIEIFHLEESGYYPQLETPDALLEQLSICLDL